MAQLDDADETQNFIICKSFTPFSNKKTQALVSSSRRSSKATFDDFYELLSFQTSFDMPPEEIENSTIVINIKQICVEKIKEGLFYCIQSAHDALADWL